MSQLSLCQALIRFGPNQGSKCRNPAVYPLRSPLYCRRHQKLHLSYQTSPLLACKKPRETLGKQRSLSYVIKSSVSYLDRLDDYTIQLICQNLLVDGAYQTLSHLVQTHQRAFMIGQPLLDQKKKAKFMFYQDMPSRWISPLPPTKQEIRPDTFVMLCRMWEHYKETIMSYLLRWNLPETTMTTMIKMGFQVNLASNLYVIYPQLDPIRYATTPLITMCRYSNVHNLQILCQLGADVNLMDMTNTSPLEALFDDYVNINWIEDIPYRKKLETIELCAKILVEYGAIKQMDVKLLDWMKLRPNRFKSISSYFWNLIQEIRPIVKDRLMNHEWKIKQGSVRRLGLIQDDIHHVFDLRDYIPWDKAPTKIQGNPTSEVILPKPN